MKKLNKSHLLFVLAGILLILMTSCGSSTEGTTHALSSNQAGKVALLMTDVPAEEFSSISMTVTKASLLSEKGDPVVIFSGERRIDLLALQEDYDLFSIAEGIPSGKYTKIRLEVIDPEIVTLGGDVIKGEQIHLTADGKVDLLPDSSFEVLPGKTLHILLNMETNKSILTHITGNSSYQLRPIIHIKIREELLTQRVTLNGTIVSIDPGSQTFVLETSYPILCLKDKNNEDHVRTYFIRVITSSDTSIFEVNGLPGDFDSLTVGQYIFVRGSISVDGSLSSADTNRVTATATATLIEIGYYFRIHGYISTSINGDNRFGFTPGPGQGIYGDLVVQVFPQETMIFEAGTFKELTPADLVLGTRVMIRGVVNLEQDSVMLYASLVKIKQPGSVHLEGTINDLNLLSRSFTLVREDGNLFVYIPPAGVVMHIYNKEMEDGLEIDLIPFSFLLNGDKVHVIGILEGTDVFRARQVIIENL